MTGARKRTPSILYIPFMDVLESSCNISVCNVLHTLLSDTLPGCNMVLIATLSTGDTLQEVRYCCLVIVLQIRGLVQKYSLLIGRLSRRKYLRHENEQEQKRANKFGRAHETVTVALPLDLRFQMFSKTSSICCKQ